VSTNRRSGFTLIELMVVISIISLLVVALLPQISSIMGKGDEAVTRARIELLRQMIQIYAKNEGDFPPSEFGKAEKNVKVKADTTNMGIECMMIHLHQRSLGANFSLEDKADWLGNTDGDDNGSEIPALKTTEKLEVVDAWHNPLVYFHNASYRKPQEVVLSDGEGGGGGEVVTVSAMKGSRDYVNSRKYQILSAGEDGEFGTDDDICYPEKILK
jgi:prepilin-type N-terminal cleavage/methylation domain-containing protein